MFVTFADSRARGPRPSVSRPPGSANVCVRVLALYPPVYTAADISPSLQSTQRLTYPPVYKAQSGRHIPPCTQRLTYPPVYTAADMFPDLQSSKRLTYLLSLFAYSRTPPPPPFSLKRVLVFNCFWCPYLFMVLALRLFSHVSPLVVSRHALLVVSASSRTSPAYRVSRPFALTSCG